ncbi:MAG: site-specific integrase [Chryseobacterium sp.]|nr:MAG: site-specific integrase [Chryseobacterium sp.]
MELAENKKKIFTDYFKEKADNATSSIGAWKASYGYFAKFYGTVLFSDINKALIDEFKAKLLTTFQLKSTKHKLKRNSAASYFIKFVQVLEMAYDDNYLSQSFKRGIDWIKEEDVEKSFLTLDECRKLFTTDFSDETLKKYCTFALLSGLRYIDINSLRWQDLVEREGVNYINFRIKKTSSFQYHPISKEAVALMGERKIKTDFVFERIKYHSLNNDLRKWLIKAEIDKKVTFHNFRTSYAVIQLEAGADIYLISKMLGHKSVTTTQIYAKIVDSRKVSTINNIVLGS